MEEEKINNLLCKINGYIGTYSLDEIEKLSVRIFPSFMVINLDLRSGIGTHWIAVALFLNDVYVCDSLGALIPTERIPTELTNFLFRVSFNKRLHVSQQLQPINSTKCGLYSTYFVKSISEG